MVSDRMYIMFLVSKIDAQSFAVAQKIAFAPPWTSYLHHHDTQESKKNVATAKFDSSEA